MTYAIILAAGQGQRMKDKKDKMLLPACDRPLIYYPFMAFNDHPEVDEIIVVTNKINKKGIEKVIKSYGFTKIKKIVMGGLRRQDSVAKGFQAIPKISKKDDIVIVHNGDNPLPSHLEITNSIEQAKEQGACIVGHKITSTVKEVNKKKVVKTHNRDKLFAAETPQVAQYGILKKALAHTEKEKLEVTDEAMMLEAIGQKVVHIEADENNFKVTTQADYTRLRTALGELPEDFRVGLGQDSHMFEEKKKGLTLCNVLLKDELKLKANSDGDVVLHAIFNAISQAIGAMSLGFYADSVCEKGEKNSAKYIEIILDKAKKQGFKMNSLGIMIECGDPKIDPLVPQFKKSLSKIFNLHARRIGITATTGEKCTVFGEGLGIQCFAIVSLVKN